MSTANQLVELSTSLEEWLQIMMLTPLSNPLDLDCLWGVPVMIHGAPGIGKTARVKDVARSLNLFMETVELAGKQPEDAGGAPFLRKNAQTGIEEVWIACTLPAVNELNNHGHGILFLDELPNARPATQGAFLSMISERRIGNTRFSPHIRVVAAGNPPGESAGAFMLSPPMSNRFAHRDLLPPTAEEFSEFLMNEGSAVLKNIHNMESKVQSEWNDIWPALKGQLSGFARSDAKYIFDLPKVGNVHRGKAWASPRSLFTAGRSVATARIMGKDLSKQGDVLTSLVGPGVGDAWGEWASKANLPDPETVITKGWEVDTRRLDVVHAVLTSVVSYTVSRPTPKERQRCGIGAWKYIKQVVDSSLLDLAFSAAGALVRAELGANASEEIQEASRGPMKAFLNANLILYASASWPKRNRSRPRSSWR